MAICLSIHTSIYLSIYSSMHLIQGSNQFVHFFELDKQPHYTVIFPFLYFDVKT